MRLMGRALFEERESVRFYVYAELRESVLMCHDQELLTIRHLEFAKDTA
jgi:hypothetical protein